MRIVSPDVGGGFGYKGILLPEDICLGWLAMRCGHPVRWIEDRREHLTRGRELPRTPLPHHRLCRSRRQAARHRLRGDRRFRRLFLLSVFGLPRGGAGREHSARPLRLSLLSLPHLFGRDQQVPDPALSRRRAHGRLLRARIDARRGRARSRDWSRMKCRRSNLVRPEQMPFDNITRKHFDSGDYPEALRRALARDRSRRPFASGKSGGEPDGRLIGVGLGDLLRTGRAWHLRLRRLGHPDGAGPRTGDGAPDAGRRAGAARRRPFARPEHGDDARPGRSRNPRRRRRQDQASCTATRNIRPIRPAPGARARAVMAGGAVATACKEIARRAEAIGAHLLQADPDAVEFVDGAVRTATGSVSCRRSRALGIGARKTCRRRSIRAASRRRSATSRSATPARSATPPISPRSPSIPNWATSKSSTMSSSRTPASCSIRMVADGQIYGGLAQGIGTALYEEMRFDSVRPAARIDLRRLYPARSDGDAGAAPRAHGDAVALYGVRREGPRRRAAPSRRRRRSATRSTTRFAPLGAEVLHSPMTPRRIARGDRSRQTVERQPERTA